MPAPVRVAFTASRMTQQRPIPTPGARANAVTDQPGGTDMALVERVRRGEPAAWNEFIRRYQDRLFAVCVRMVHNRDLATDLAQDAFVKIIQGLPTFDGRSKLSTWMIRITMNVCLSRLRSEKLRRHASLEGLAENSSASGQNTNREGGFRQEREQTPVASVEAHEDRQRVLEALRTLDPEQRAVLILCDAQGHSYEEIAEVMSVAVGTVKSRLFRARTALREAVEKLSR